MFIPLQDIQGLVFNEYINMKNALKLLKYWDKIIDKLPNNRKLFLKEKVKVGVIFGDKWVNFGVFLGNVGTEAEFGGCWGGWWENYIKVIGVVVLVVGLNGNMKKTHLFSYNKLVIKLRYFWF